MNKSQLDNTLPKDTHFILALHSSTENLGIGLISLENDGPKYKNVTINVGRDLSKYLFKHIEEILPYKSWSRIKRLAVATGPGGFTGTRLTVILARTIAQQLNCSLDGISSYELMAYRVEKNQI